MMFILNRAALFFLALLVSVQAGATLNPQMGSIEDLVEKLKLFYTYEASFEQKTIDQNQFEVQSLTGTIKLMKPCYFFWKTDDPFAQQLTSDCKNIWHYDVDLEQVVVQEYKQQRENAPIMLILEDSQRLSDEYKLEHHEKNGTKEDFYLRARRDDNVLNYIHLGFFNNELVGLEFTDSLHQKTVIHFSGIQLNQEVSMDTFTFSVPENADILYE